MLPSTTFNLELFLAGVKKSLKTRSHLGCWSLLGGLLLIMQWPSPMNQRRNTDFNTGSLLPVPTTVRSLDKKVVIGVVSCPLASGQNSKLNEEAGVMIKSIILSARLHDVPAVEFHLFLEDVDGHRDYFLGKLAEFGANSSQSVEQDSLPVNVRMVFHSAFDVVPKRYHEGMVYHPTHRCGFVRMFFPSALPQVDSILYLDTDVIVTGNIGKLWERLAVMKGEQLIGVARNNEPEDKNYGWLDKEGFGDIPHVAPKGLNSGMLLMNLTRMRSYGWEEKLTRLFRDYGKIVMLNDQRLLNIMLYYDPGLLHLVPCQFDLMHTHCDHGWTCSGALEDPYGVHLIHGACDMFDEGKSFYPIYKMYLEANLTGDKEEDAETFKQLTWQIRNSYHADQTLTDGASTTKSFRSKCYGTLNRLLFKNIS